MDFKLNFNTNRPIRILQLTDMQIIDGTQRRYPERLDQESGERWNPQHDEENIYAPMRFLIEASMPDLIVITGDMIYGEFDDSGESLKCFVQHLDSYRIPWAVVFGNHDNESKKGISWQCNEIASAKYSVFKRGTVFGNSNYSIGIFRDGKLIRTLFMVDSNGCGAIGIEPGIRNEQLAWMEDEASEISREYGQVPSFAYFHEPTDDFQDAYIAAGYQSSYDIDEEHFASYTIGDEVHAKNGDFGNKREAIYACCRQKILPVLKKIHTDGVFVGHCHKINTSVMYEGIRFTFGFKTGFYDYYDEAANGGTLILLDGDKDFLVKHIQYEITESI